MPAADLPLIETFSALADSTRGRMLQLLEAHELTVSELCAVLQLPQSTVSRQLKTLADAGWVSSRRDGTSRYYALSVESRTGTQSQIWQIARRQIADEHDVAQDARRLARVLARRSETSQHFFASAAGQWDRLRAELFGEDFAVRALASLLPPGWVVGDLGCGTGAFMELLAPHVARVVGVDGSDDMLAAAHERLRAIDNVELRRGALEALPIEDAALDAATMMLVLHHLPAPAAAIDEAARVVRPGGRLLVVDMQPHDREEYRRQMGHVWLGFADDQMRRWLQHAGFEAIRIDTLTPHPDTRGPGLFAASASRPAASVS